MVIATAFQTFEGVVQRKSAGDYEYISGIITYADGRIEKLQTDLWKNYVVITVQSRHNKTINDSQV